MVCLCGVIHPLRDKRYLWGLAAITITAVKFAVVTIMLGRSSYPVADRYLMMFIAPSLMTFMLGAESLALWLDRWKKGAQTVVAATLLMFVVVWRRVPLVSAVMSTPRGFQVLMTTPQNSSSTYSFFEQVKARKKPLLILSDHCYASDIPKMYMEFIGSRPVAPVVVLDTNGTCETSKIELQSQTLSFLNRYHDDGLVVFFYDSPRPNLVPCPSSEAFMSRSQDFFCAGILSPAQAAPALIPRS
jgi:hypothetical protein